MGESRRKEEESLRISGNEGESGSYEDFEKFRKLWNILGGGGGGLCMG